MGLNGISLGKTTLINIPKSNNAALQRVKDEMNITVRTNKLPPQKKEEDTRERHIGGRYTNRNNFLLFVN